VLDFRAMKLGGKRDRAAPDSGPLRSRWSIGRPWVAASVIAVLLLVAVFLGIRLAQRERQVERLRTELRGVYAEAESLRTSTLQSQQRVSLLEQQVRQLRAERETILKQLRTPATARPAARAGATSRRAKPRPRPAPTTGDWSFPRDASVYGS
jgi:DNA repair exonuclease SbcCD ATPase subunit